MKKLIYIVAILLSYGTSFAEKNNQSICKITLADTGWSDLFALNLLTEAILDHQGVSVETKTLSLPVAFLALKENKIDAFLGVWLPSMVNDVEPYLNNQSFILLTKPIVANAKYNLAVPKYTYEKGLANVASIHSFASSLKKTIYGIEPGNDGNRIIQKILKTPAYNLSNFTLLESSEAAMLGQVKRAINAKQDIVFLAWKPHIMNQLYDIVYLDDESMNWFGPNNGEAKIYVAVSNNLNKTCPEAYAQLNKISLSSELLSELMSDLTPSLNAGKANQMNQKQVVANFLNKHSDLIAK